MLRKIDTNIWVAEQPLKYFGLDVGTRMTVIRLENGNLLVISPIEVQGETIDQINEIGKVSYIIAPNLYHYLFAAKFKTIYPQAEFYAPPGLDLKRPELKIDRFLGKDNNEFSGEIEYLFFEGFKTLALDGFSLLNEYVFFHPESQTLILTDTAFNFDESFSLTTRLVARAIGGYKKLSPSILEKFATKDKEKIKRSVTQVLKWDFRRVIVAHGTIVENNAKQSFREGYEWFLN
jgi:Domain of unknown function (DUF4336)